VFQWIAIYGFVFAAMHGEVGLLVAIEIEFAQKDAARDGFLEYAGSDVAAVPDDVARQSNI
jgi:hypothetical protein